MSFNHHFIFLIINNTFVIIIHSCDINLKAQHHEPTNHTQKAKERATRLCATRSHIAFLHHLHGAPYRRNRQAR
ncbi:hypothetical protein FGO68_gene6165 [Halteria grandinella]|uniref:Secreted protein n=1 Tax=Halteria grandinella TaxID=5974 RepID=A0A8J8N9U5_HALGN|nr:hypothetical protein FGO68_gene6165 [Halteria grandinella]